MKLSMWIVYDWLHEYQPEARIQEGKQTINGVRFLADEVNLQKEYLYIGYGDQYIDKWNRNVICVNSTDIITLSASDVYAVFNEIQQMLEFYNSWEMQILQAINERRELPEILELAPPVLKTGVAVSDLSLRVLGEAHFQGVQEKQKLNNGYLDATELRLIQKQLRENLTNRDPYITNTAKAADLDYNIFSREGRLIARFISLGGADDEHTASRMQLVASLGQLLELWFMIRETEFTGLFLFLDILEGRVTDPGMISVRADSLGWPDGTGMQTFALLAGPEDPAGPSLVMRTLENRFPQLVSISHEECQLLIVNEVLVPKQEFLRELTGQLHKYGVTCGSSYPFDRLQHLPGSARQAILAVQSADACAGVIRRCEEVAIEYMQEALCAAVEPEVLSPALRTLQEYDRANDTEYYRTLQVYLMCERNQTLTAKRLFIHRNSLVYRIGRIGQILNLDLDDERERRYLLLSYIVQERRESV